MNTPIEWISFGFAVIGTLFFVSGSIGLYRLPDLVTRLHALSKADNVGLGFIVLATMLRAEDFQTIFKAGLVWMLMLVTSTCLCMIIVRENRDTEESQKSQRERR